MKLIQYGPHPGVHHGIYADPNMDENPSGRHRGGVDKGSPGDKAGLKAGDILYEVAGKRIKHFAGHPGRFQAVPGGRIVEILYLRGQEKRKASILLEENKKPAKALLIGYRSRRSAKPGRGKAIIR